MKHIVIILLCVIAISSIALGFLLYYYDRTFVYHCKDQRKRIPVIFKLNGYGLFKNGAHLEALVHEKDGEIYVISAHIKDYSPFNNNYFYSPTIPGNKYGSIYKWTITLDMEASSFSIHDKKGIVLYSGLCST